MALSDRDIIITPNRGASSEPIITLRGADAASSASMVMRVINSGTVSTLSFEGTSGQLFAVSDTFAGTIFSVNDVSGIPSIEVLDTGDIKLAEWNGKVRVGGANNNENATSTTTGELQVVGGVGVSGDVYVGGGMTVVGTLNAAVIAGSISSAATATNAANVSVTNDPSSASTMYPTFVSATSGNQAIRVDGSGLVWIPSTNRLGIGTTTPTSRLHVAGPGNTTGGNIHLGDDVNSTSKWTYITGAHYNGATNPTGFSLIGGLSDSTKNAVVIGGNIYESNPATEIQFWTHTATTHATGGSQRMVIDTNGNVGINTTAPGAKLHILKSAPSGVTSVPTDTDLLIDSNTNSYLTFRQGADIGAYGGIQWVDNNVGAYIVFRNYTGSVAAGSDSIIYGTYQDHIFQAGTSGTVNGKTEVARITSTGRLGIGTNAPDIPLDIRGTDSVIQAREDGTSSAWRARILSRNSSANKAAFLGTYGSIPGVFAHNYALSAWAPLYINTTNGSTDGDTVIIAGSGNVGIGNNAPGRKLDVTGVTNVSSHITQGPLISRPNVSWGASGTSTGAVVIKFPGGTGNYGMVHIVIDIYTYDGENASTIIIGGHNWNSAWYNFGATRIGAFSKGVRVAFKDGQYAVVLGTNTSTWSYGQVVVRKIQNGSYYSGIMDLGGTYTITQDASAESYTYISSNLITAGSAGAGGWNSGNDGSGSGLDADLLDGLDSTQFLRRDVSNSMFAGQTSQLSFENQTTFFRFAFNELRFYDWNNGTDIFGLDEHAYATTSMRAPIFYDRNDTAYYVDPASTGKAMLVNGNIELTARSESWAEGIRINVPTAGTWGGIRINRSGASGPGNWAIGYTGLNSTNDLTFYSGTTNTIQVNLDHSANLSSIGSMRAPIFYDSNDTNYYVDPNSESRLWYTSVNVGQETTGGANSSNAGLVLRGNYNSNTWAHKFHKFDNGSGVPLYLSKTVGTAAWTAIQGWGSGLTYDSQVFGSFGATSAVYSPIFYDSNNTGYYTDPASTSVLNNVTINGTLTYSGAFSGGTDYARRLDNATRTAISVGGNASTYYPVVLQIGAGATAQQYGEFVLERGGYDDPGYTGVNFSTFNMRMSVKASGWGFGSTYENCEALYQNVQLVANWQQVSESSRLIIWLRGATVYYLWNVVGNTTLVNANAAGGNIVESNPSFYTYTFTPTTTIQPKAQHSKYFSNGTMSDGSSRISSLGIGTNASGTDGRLDVTADIRAPIYYDSNNTSFYTDPASTSVLSTMRVPGATAGWSLMVGENNTTGIEADNARYGLVVNAPYYPHIYLKATSDSGNTQHGPVFSMQSILTGGGYRKWGMGIPNRNPDELSFGWYDNNTNPHYGVGINWSYPASMWIDTGHNLHSRGSMRTPIFYDRDDTSYYLDPNADLSLKVYGEISNSNYVPGNLQPGALNIGRTDRDYGWDSTSWSGDVRAGILANCSELWEFVIHDSGDSVESVFRYNGGDQLLMGRDIGWGTLYIEAASSFRAPIFYDSNNTAYYTDPASTSVLNALTVNSINVGSINAGSHSHDVISYLGRISAETGRAVHRTGVYTFGTYTAANPGGNPPLTYPEVIAWGGGTGGTIQLAGDWISTTSTPLRVRSLRDCCQDWSSWSTVATSNESFTNNVDLRAPIFYDSNNTGYYTDPASTSNLSDLQLTGAGNKYLYINPGNGWESMVRYNGGSGSSWYVGKRISTSLVGTADFHFYSEAAGQTQAGIDTSGNMFARGSVRSPIFYDSNDTGYFADPASSSTFRQLRVAAQTQSAQYNYAAIEVREYNYGGVQVDATYNYPRIGFHWGGRVASSIAMSSNGWINIMNNPGTGYENLIAAQGLFTSEVTAYYSDIRLKTRVGTIDNAIEKVKAIETFKYVNNELANSFGFTDTDVHVGVSAQSVEAVLPEIVRHAPFDMKSQDGDTISASGEWYKTVQYDKLVPLLIEAIKEQQIIIEQHRAELDELRELKELLKQSLGK